MGLFVDVRVGLAGIILTIGLFRFLRVSLEKRWKPPKSVSEKGLDEEDKWANLVVSWIHAFTILVWDLSCIIFYPELNDDLIDFINSYSYLLVIFSTGYFLYDTLNMMVHSQLFSMWDVTLHHVVVICMFLYNALTLRCIGYTVIALLTEVNTFFLHTRKLMQMYKIPFNSKSYRINVWVNIISFIVFRGYSLCRITYGMFKESNRVEWRYFLTLSFCMLVMNVMNVIFFAMLIKSDLLRRKSAKLLKKDDCSILDSPLKEKSINNISNNVCENSKIVQ